MNGTYGLGTTLVNLSAVPVATVIPATFAIQVPTEIGTALVVLTRLQATAAIQNPVETASALTVVTNVPAAFTLVNPIETASAVTIITKIAAALSLGVPVEIGNALYVASVVPATFTLQPTVEFAGALVQPTVVTGIFTLQVPIVTAISASGFVATALSPTLTLQPSTLSYDNNFSITQFPLTSTLNPYTLLISSLSLPSVVNGSFTYPQPIIISRLDDLVTPTVQQLFSQTYYPTFPKNYTALPFRFEMEATFRRTRVHAEEIFRTFPVIGRYNPFR